MKSMRIICAVAAVLAAGSAAAFQEQRQAPAPAAPSKAAPSEQAPAVSAPVVPQGTEVRVPGFGRLGTLPKIDFGLELLYGGADPQRQMAPAAPTGDPTDGMALRGSIKHKF